MRGESGSTELREHLSRVLQRIFQIVRIQSSMHVEGVLLKAGDSGREPFLFVFNSVGDHDDDDDGDDDGVSGERVNLI